MIAPRPLVRLRPWRAALLTVLLCTALTGCGGGLGEVTGVVRYQGKPLSHGTIQFLGHDGVPRSGTIRTDGTFTVAVPVGAAKVIVTAFDEARMSRFTRQLAGRGGRAAPPPVPGDRFPQIPLRYADWDASGLTVVVEPGNTAHDFALTAN
jgi:hypothetical protein